MGILYWKDFERQITFHYMAFCDNLKQSYDLGSKETGSLTDFLTLGKQLSANEKVCTKRFVDVGT